MRMQEQALAKENLARYQKSLDGKRQFIRCVCHEVRSPLSTVLSGIYMVEYQAKQYHDPSIEETLEEMKQSCQSATDIMKAILIYQQLESRTLTLKPMPVDITAYIEEYVRQFASVAKAWDVTLSIESELSEQIFIAVSTEEFSVAIRALIDNAIKFTPPAGSVVIRIMLLPGEGAETVPYVRIEVIDTGPGMTQDTQKILFHSVENFSPTTNETHQGFGVAMCVVHGIIDSHKGRMGVASEGLGRGSIFFIDLPVAEMREPEAPSPPKVIIHQGTFVRSMHPSTTSSPTVTSRFQLVRNLMKIGLFRNEESSVVVAPKIHSIAHTPTIHRVDVKEGAEESIQRSSEIVPINPSPTRSAGLSVHKIHNYIGNLLTKTASSIREIPRVDSNEKLSSISLNEEYKQKPTEMRLLLVDDVASCRKMMSKLIATDKCICDEAKDGVEAIQRVRDSIALGFVYDGILIDSSMPNMSGPAATQVIRSLGYENKIFGVTGNSLPEDIQEFIAHGADEVRIKPLKKVDIDYMLQGECILH